MTQYSIWTINSGIFATFAKSTLYANNYHNAGTLRVPVTYQLIMGGGRVILFDTGGGDREMMKIRNIVEWEPIETQLAKFELTPEDVDTIVLSHMHWDHGGQAKCFPKATQYLQKAEMEHIDFVYSLPEGPTKNTLRFYYPAGDVAAMKAAHEEGRLVLIEGDYDPAPGLRIVAALDTHAPGSQMLLVDTAAGQMVISGDTAYTRENILTGNPTGVRLGSTIKCVVNLERVLNLAGGKIEMVVPAHDPDTFSFWPSWQWGDTQVGEVALAPGQKSFQPG